MTVRNRITGQAKQLEVDGLFIAVGQRPQNGPFSALLAADEDGYLLAGEDCKTSLPGVFAAGDCRSKGVRQLTTAVGDGAVAGAGRLPLGGRAPQLTSPAFKTLERQETDL